jgi:hypothetical protein
MNNCLSLSGIIEVISWSVLNITWFAIISIIPKYFPESLVLKV